MRYLKLFYFLSLILLVVACQDEIVIEEEVNQETVTTRDKPCEMVRQIVSLDMLDNELDRIQFCNGLEADCPPGQVLITGNALTAVIVGKWCEQFGIPDHFTVQEQNAILARARAFTMEQLGDEIPCPMDNVILDFEWNPKNHSDCINGWELIVWVSWHCCKFGIE